MKPEAAEQYLATEEEWAKQFSPKPGDIIKLDIAETQRKLFEALTGTTPFIQPVKFYRGVKFSKLQDPEEWPELVPDAAPLPSADSLMRAYEEAKGGR